MAKSDQVTIANRVQDVLRLMLAGAEFSDIHAFAAERGWNVTVRQLQRYVKRANRRFAKVSRRNAEQLRGRHLMQRRVLYARSFKEGDLRTALHVLRDEANLQGLYPSKNPTSSSNGNHITSSPDSPLNRRERLIRMLKAESEQDKVELKLLEQVTPVRVYHLPDTQMPLMMLNLLALMYVNEQLELAMTYLHAVHCAATEELSGAGGAQKSEQEVDPVSWDMIGKAYAYCFRVGQAGWEDFLQSLGVESDYFVQGNYQGCMLAIAKEALANVAPTADELSAMARDLGWSVDELATPEDISRRWRHQLSQVLKQ